VQDDIIEVVPELEDDAVSEPEVLSLKTIFKAWRTFRKGNIERKSIQNPYFFISGRRDVGKGTCLQTSYGG
jgi:hypothetical protein